LDSIDIDWHRLASTGIELYLSQEFQAFPNIPSIHSHSRSSVVGTMAHPTALLALATLAAPAAATDTPIALPHETQSAPTTVNAAQHQQTADLQRTVATIGTPESIAARPMLDQGLPLRYADVSTVMPFQSEPWVYAILANLALTPAIMAIVFAIMRRRIVDRLTDEVRDQLYKLEDLEGQIQAANDRAQAMLQQLEGYTQTAHQDLDQRVAGLTRDIEQQLDDMKQIERVRNECLHQIQTSALEVSEVKNRVIDSLGKLTPQAIFDVFEPELRDRLHAITQRIEQLIEPIHEHNIPIPIDAYKVRAEKALRERNFEEAITFYDEILRLQPSNTHLWTQHAYALAQLQRFTEAIASYDRALASEPGNLKVALQRARLLVRLQQYEEALKTYDRILSIDPTQIEALFGRGSVLGRLQRYEEALDTYDLALERQPDKYEVWFNRANTLGRLERYDDALLAYDRAIQLRPNERETWHNRGALLSKLQRYEEALHCYETAVEINPEQFEGWFNLGNVLSKIQRQEEALTAYDKAIGIDPNRYELWFNRAAALGQLQLYDAAIASYNKVLQLNPKNIDATYNQALLLEKLGRYTTALECIDRTIEEKPEFYDAWLASGRLLEQLGRLEEAAIAYRRAIDIDPEKCDAWYSRGRLLSDLNQHQEAMDSLGRAFQIKKQQEQVQGQAQNPAQHHNLQHVS
jgi:tetratricopeptide (TPR) repeat protein